MSAASYVKSDAKLDYSKSRDNFPARLEDRTELAVKIHKLNQMRKYVRTDLEELSSHKLISFNTTSWNLWSMQMRRPT